MNHGSSFFSDGKGNFIVFQCLEDGDDVWQQRSTKGASEGVGSLASIDLLGRPLREP